MYVGKHTYIKMFLPSPISNLHDRDNYINPCNLIGAYMYTDRYLDVAINIIY